MLTLKKLALLGTLVGAFISPAEADSVEKIMAQLQQEVRERAKTKGQSPLSHYLVVFGYEGKSNPANESHTFAAFVRSDRDGTQHWTSISWLPKDFAQTQSICIFKNLRDAIGREIRGDDCAPVVGHNYSVSETLRMSKSKQRTLGVWGPYQISPELYAKGVARASFLHRGGTKYLADDRESRTTGEAVNCMHAVSDVLDSQLGKGGFLNLGYGIWGLRGTEHVMKAYEKFSADQFRDPMRPRSYRKIQHY